MEFILISFGLVAALVVVLVLLARAYPGSGADLLDWKPTRSYETEAMLELDDVQQMIDAQNVYRRKRGAPELTEADANRMAEEDNASAREGAGGTTTSGSTSSRTSSGPDLAQWPGCSSSAAGASAPSSGARSPTTAGPCAGPRGLQTERARIERSGIEGVVADPDRVGTVLEHVGDVAVVAWALGAASGPSAPDVNGPRLERMLERLVDTPVRGFVLDEPPDQPQAKDLVAAAGETWRIPTRVVDAGRWTAASGSRRCGPP